MNKVSAAVAPPSKSTASKYPSKLARSSPASASPNSRGHSLRVHLQTRSITASKCIFCVHSISASKCISKLTQSRPPSVSPDSLDYGLQVYTIMAFKCISKLAQSPPPSASPNSIEHGLQVHLLSSPDLGLQVHLQTRSITASKCISTLLRLRPASLHDHGLQVHLQTRSIPASKCISEFIRSPSPSASQPCSFKYIFKERRRLYGDTGVTEVDRVTGSIYSADPVVDRHHLISITSYHTMKIHTLSFPAFGLTRSVRDFVDPHGRVVSYLLTFLRSLSSM